MKILRGLSNTSLSFHTKYQEDIEILCKNESGKDVRFMSLEALKMEVANGTSAYLVNHTMHSPEWLKMVVSDESANEDTDWELYQQLCLAELVDIIKTQPRSHIVYNKLTLMAKDKVDELFKKRLSKSNSSLENTTQESTRN